MLQFEHSGISLWLHNNDTKPKLDSGKLIPILCLWLHNNDTKPKHGLNNSITSPSLWLHNNDTKPKLIIIT